MDESLRRCFSEARLGDLTLRNRLIKAATFEGLTPGGALSPEYTRFHARFGEGGIGMVTLAYCAAEADGRLHGDMLYMHEGVRAPLAELVATLHATGAKVCGQLGHAGGFTKRHPDDSPRPLGPSWGFNRLGFAAGLPWVGAMTLDQIRDRVAAFGRAAAFMKAVGFDAIEIHFGHGYALSQFISPKTNRRTDDYGGSLQGRMRLPLEVLAAAREAVGDGFPLLGKISMEDGIRGSVGVDEGVEIAAMLEAGGLDCIICSAGSSSHDPMMLFRGDSLAPGLIEHEASWVVRTSLRVAGGWFFKDYPYEETYLLDPARRVRDRVQCAVCYIGGVCTTDSLRRVMAAGFDFVQLGRALIFDPDLPKHAAADPEYVNGCNHCNQCATLIEAPGGVRCVERPDNFS